MCKFEKDPTIGKKACIGYQTAIELVGLVSQEIYSRFNAMLTANSIIIAIIGLAFTNKYNLPLPVNILLPIAGLILCCLWFLFNEHGVYWQNIFRKEAIRLENQYFSDTFKLITNTSEVSQNSKKKNSEIPRLVRWFPYHRTSRILIIVFAMIYIVILTLTNVPKQNPSASVANITPNLVLKEAYADIVTDVRIGGGVFRSDDLPDQGTPHDVIPTVLYYHVTIKNEGKEIITFKEYESQFDSMAIIDNIELYLLVEEELAELLPEMHDGYLSIYKGQTSWWAMLPGEEMEFWTRFNLGASDSKGIDSLPRFPDQDTLDKIKSFAYNASLVIKDKETNQEIARFNLKNYATNTVPKSMAQRLEISEEVIKHLQKEAVQLEKVIKNLQETVQ